MATSEPESVSITFRTLREKREALDGLADSLNQDRSQILNEAITYYLDLYHWQTEQIEKGLEQANRGEFISEKEVNTLFDRLENQ